MEKRTPHCKLSIVKAIVKEGRVKATMSAFSGAREIGIDDLAAMCDVVMSLNQENFYKSMTTHNDHQIWQDVYRKKIDARMTVYLKLTVIDDVLIVSFKEQ